MNRPSSLEQQLRLKQVQLEEQKSNVEDLTKLLSLTPAGAAKTNGGRENSESPDSVRHAILTRNLREFTISKSMELSEQIQPLVSSRSRELLNLLSKSLVTPHRLDSPLFNCPAPANGDVSGVVVESTDASSPNELQEIIQELYRQMETAEQLESLFDQISVQNTYLKQQLESEKTEHGRVVAALKEQHADEIRETKSAFQKSQDYSRQLESELEVQKRIISDLQSARQNSIENYQSALQNASSLILNPPNQNYNDPSHFSKLKNSHSSFEDAGSVVICNATGEPAPTESFMQEVEKETLRTQNQTLHDTILEKRKTIIDLKAEIQTRDQKIFKLEEMLEKAEWVVGEKFKLYDKNSTTYQSKVQILRNDMQKYQKTNLEMEKSLMEKDVRIRELETLRSSHAHELKEARSELQALKEKELKVFDDHQQALAELESRIEQLVSELSSIETDHKLSDSDVKITKFNSEIRQHHSTIEELRDLLHKKDQNLHNSLEEKDSLSKALEESQRRIEFLQSQLDNIIASNAELSANVSRLEQDFLKRTGAKEGELHELRTDREKLLSERNALTKSFERIALENKELQSKIPILSTELHSAKASGEDYKRQFHNSEERVKVLSDSMENFKNNIKILEDELKLSKNQNEDLQRKITELEAAVVACDIQTRESKSEAENLRRQVEDLNTEFAVMETDKDLAVEQYESLRSEIRRTIGSYDKMIPSVELAKADFESLIVGVEERLKDLESQQGRLNQRSQEMDGFIKTMIDRSSSCRQETLRLSGDIEFLLDNSKHLRQKVEMISSDADSNAKQLSRQNHELLESIQNLQRKASDTETLLNSSRDECEKLKVTNTKNAASTSELLKIVGKSGNNLDTVFNCWGDLARSELTLLDSKLSVASNSILLIKSKFKDMRSSHSLKQQSLLDETSSLKTSLAEALQKVEQTEDQLIAQTENCEKLEATIQEYQTRLAETEAALVERDAANQFEKDDLVKKIQKQSDELVEAVNLVETIRSELTSRVDELESELAEKIQHILDLEHAKSELETQMKNMEIVASIAEEAKTDCHSWKQRYLSLRADSDQEMVQYKEEIYTFRNQVEKMEHTIDRKEKERLYLLDQLKEHDTLVNTISPFFGDFGRICSTEITWDSKLPVTLSPALALVIKNATAMKEELIRAQTFIEENEQKSAGIIENFERVKHLSEERQLSLEQARTLLVDLNEKNIDIQQQNDNLTAQLKEISGQEEMKAQQLMAAAELQQTLTNQIKDLRSDLDKSTLEARNFQTRLSDLEKIAETRMTLIGDLKTTNAQQKETIMQYESLLKNKSATISDYHAQVESLEASLQNLREKYEFQISAPASETMDAWNQTTPDDDKMEMLKAEAILLQLQLDEMKNRTQQLEGERLDMTKSMELAEAKSKQTLSLLQAELEEVSRNYNHFESLAGELHQANEELRQTLNEVRDQKDILKNQIDQFQSAHEETKRELGHAQEMNSQSELKIRQLLDTVQELQLRRNNGTSLQDFEKLIKELNSDRLRLEKSRKQYKKSALSLEHQLEEKEGQICLLKEQVSSFESQQAELKKNADRKIMEAQMLMQHLTEAAVALKEDTSGPLKESDLDFTLVDDLENSPQKDVNDKMDSARIQKIFKSIAQMSKTEIVYRYEAKLKRLYELVNKGNRTLNSGIKLVNDRKNRKASIQV